MTNQAIDIVEGLSAPQWIQLWEIGQSLHPLDRALRVLWMACPETNGQDLAALSLNRRNALLLRLYERIVGPVLECQAQCPECGEYAEFSVDARQLLDSVAEDTQAEEPYRIRVGPYRILCRVPNSHDLALAVRCGSLMQGRRDLLGRCVLAIEDDSGPVSHEQLSADLLDELGDQLDARAPLANPRFRLDCPACGQAWSASFDILQFLWFEIEGRAKRLLYNVHVLASAYGWSEADILNMSATRQAVYLRWI